MDLFNEENPPLSKRVMPENLDEFVGQKHLVGPNKPIRTMIEKKILHSMVLVGPPACGKTTLANLIAKEFNMFFIKESALTLDSDSLKKIFNISSQKVLFIDEIHRLTKPKQDMLLGPLERGEIYVIGATTENPLFIMQPALRSRIFVFELLPLSDEDKKIIILNALKKDKLFSNYEVEFKENALDNLIKYSFDIRKALNTLEIILLEAIKEKSSQNDFQKDKKENFNENLRETFQKSYDENTSLSFQKISKTNNEENEIENKIENNKGYDKKNIKLIITNEKISLILQTKETFYSSYDGHYDTISAFIKSIRGSDIDASLYYLALMLESGEDPLFIARRLVILASEDIGLAYPEALSIATSAMLAIERIGMPEGRIILGQVTALFASLPKSNSAYMGLEAAIKSIKEEPIMKIPAHLKNIEVKAFGKEEKAAYKYPHDFPKHWVKQQYLEKEKKFFNFGNLGFEGKLAKWHNSLDSEQNVGEGEDG
ncbi:MAG: replication-associated recombination protein A [Spirochaetota bacterium]